MLPGWSARVLFQSSRSGFSYTAEFCVSPPPLEFLTQRISLFRLYYQPGDMEVVEQSPGRAVLRLVDWDEADALFCRRQTGGLQRAVELAGGAQPAARHVRCAAEGDAFCEWELTWK